MSHILLVAAENGALPGGKVGGIGDVVHDVPVELAKRDHTVSVITAAYGSLHRLAGAKLDKTLKIFFGGKQQTLKLYHLKQAGNNANIRHYVIDHPLFSLCGTGKIYCDDPAGRPFASDATKFALFCTGVAEAINQSAFDNLDVLHLQDWHASFLLILRRFLPRYKKLQKLQCAYTIHNLALQGIRPFKGDESSLEEWFPGLQYDPTLLGDPRWSDCINPMAAAIRLADTVHAVSPGYALEILQPDNASAGHHGGEGLEHDLNRANQEKRLFGILNGCEYPHNFVSTPVAWPDLLQQMTNTVLRWVSGSANVSSAHFIALNALNKMSTERPKMLLTSVGRITEQKVALLRQSTSSGMSALHATLEAMGDYAMLFMIGSGDSDYEQFLTETSAQYSNFVFLRGYSDGLANAFYENGDLFLMPSSFEPCGISQMLAMRAGQPCLVHGVGGLRDTVIDGKTGYSFSGDNPTEQADALVSTVQRALKQHSKKSSKWQNMCKAAAAARFEWDHSIDAYLTDLYKIS